MPLPAGPGGGRARPRHGTRPGRVQQLPRPAPAHGVLRTAARPQAPSAHRLGDRTRSSALSVPTTTARATATAAGQPGAATPTTQMTSPAAAASLQGGRQARRPTRGASAPSASACTASADLQYRWRGGQSHEDTAHGARIEPGERVYLRRPQIRGPRASADHPTEVSLPGHFAVLLDANSSGKTTIVESIVHRVNLALPGAWPPEGPTTLPIARGARELAGNPLGRYGRL